MQLGGGDCLAMSYSELEATARNAKAKAEQLRELMTSLSADVNGMCDNWTASASPVFREDYEKLAKNVTQTSTVVDELSTQVENYSRDMQALDQSYSSSKVSS